MSNNISFDVLPMPKIFDFSRFQVFSSCLFLLRTLNGEIMGCLQLTTSHDSFNYFSPSTLIFAKESLGLKH